MNSYIHKERHFPLSDRTEMSFLLYKKEFFRICKETSFLLLINSVKIAMLSLLVAEVTSFRIRVRIVYLEFAAERIRVEICKRRSRYGWY